MKILFCGGAGEVGASCVLLRTAGKNLIFDSGIRMGSKDPLPNMRLIQENGGVDAIFISHAHMDHSGSLPILSREFPDAKIYMTHASKDLIRVLLFDSLKIMENREEEIPIYAEIHVKNALDRILCFSPGFTFYPFNNDIAVTFYSAGHVAGAVSIYVSSSDGTTFYSGDFSVTPQRTVEGAFIPRLRPDLAIFESTYGDRLHSNREIEEERLVSKVKEIIALGKKILIPAFALGRAQEVILILKKAINKGDLPPFKIFVDGMVKDICRVYKQNPNYLRKQLGKKLLKQNDIFYDDNIIAVTGNQSRREEIVALNEGCCIISSSGMLTGGPSRWYALKLSEDEGNYIALTGYQDEESPGRQLLEIADQTANEARIIKLGDVTFVIKCGIGRYGLSAHADKTEIISFVHSLGSRRLFFVHGNQEVVSNLAGEVQKEYNGKIYAPKNGEIFEIDIKSPRKQLEKAKLKTLNKGITPTESDLPHIWSFISTQYEKTAGFTLEELIYLWKGKNDLSDNEYGAFNIIVNSSKYFEPETRRPFIFHAVDPETLSENKEEFMEVNKMLTLVDEFFPPETGLYKKGAKFDEKVTLLFFNFPQVALIKYGDKYKQFEALTGWNVSVNNECNVSSAQNLINSLLGADADKIGKISYFVTENLFKVRIGCELPNIIKLQADFKELTGVKLILENSENENSIKNDPVKANKDQVEQNEALTLIQEAFDAVPDKLYKKSLKIIDGNPCIELSFISPIIGEKYRYLIDELESRLRWSIKINQTPNQNELINVGCRLLNNNGLLLKKNLSYIPKEMNIVAYLLSGKDTELEKVAQEFQKLTGVKIIFGLPPN